jgi:copper transport protein
VLRRACLALVAAAVGSLGLATGLGLGAAPAAAHAVLQSTSPGDRSALDEAPDAVELVFNEPVSSPVGGVRAFDGDGERVDEGDLELDGATLRLGLRGGLGDGAYIVTYRVISQDGHPITGAFTFTVGDAAGATDETVAGLLGSEDDQLWDILGGVARALAYGGTLLAAGVAVFAVSAHDGGPEKRALRRLIGTGAAVGALGVLAAIPLSAARITGLGLGAITNDGVAGDVLGESVGISVAVVLAGLVVLAGSAGAGRPLRSAPTIAAALAASGGFALAGHTATAEPRWAATGSAAVHAAAAAIWFGGLVALGVVLSNRRDRGAEAAPVVARFSSMAALSLLAVAACGLYLGYEEVGSLDALTSTTYGRVLLAKTGVVALVAAAGGWNRYRLVPALPKAPKAAAGRLRTVVRAEAAGLAVAIALTGALVNITPAADAAAGGIFSETVPFGDGSVNVVVDPNQPGPNLIHLYFYDAGGRVADLEFDELDLVLTLPSAEIGPLEREMVRAGAGHYQAVDVDLLAGTWTVEVVARVDTFDQLTASVDVPVNP